MNILIQSFLFRVHIVDKRYLKLNSRSLYYRDPIKMAATESNQLIMWYKLYVHMAREDDYRG